MSKVDAGWSPDKKGDLLKQLRAFCHAARIGSISRAAEHVMSSQPAVSIQIRMLEEAFGVTLFDRRGPRISLTAAGQRLYEHAMPLVTGMDRLPDTFAERHHGVAADVLTIGAGQTSAAYLLPKYVERFQESYPEVGVEIRTGNGQQRMGWLRSYELDLVVGSMDVELPDFEFHPMLVSKFVVITASDHPLAGRASVGVGELATYPFIRHSASHYVARMVDFMLRLHGVAPEVVVEVDGWGVITNYVAAGVGISVVPDLSLTEHDRLWRISIEGEVPPRRYGAITRRDDALPLTTRRFLSLMVPGLAGTS